MARPVKTELIADPTRYVRGFRTARRETQQFTDHTKRAGSAVKAAFAAFSAATVVREMGNWASAARDANRVAAETDAVIRSTRGAAGLSAKGFADLAKQVMRTTAVDDDLIQSGENMLATFKNIKAGGPDQVFERTTRAAVDLAAGMNQGQVTAGGMQTASIQLGKALNDPIKGATALQRVGIKLDDTQKQQIKTFVEHGQVAKAQGIILAEVESQFKGRAEANATASQRLAVTWGNMQEVLGNLLIPAIDRGATIMANTLDVIDRNRTAFGLLFGVLAGGAAIIGGLIVAEKIHRAVTDATRVATEAWAVIQKGLNVVLGTTTVEASAASVAEGRLAGTTAAAGTAAGAAAPKFAALQASLAAMSAIGAAAWTVFKEGQETLRLVRGESDTALDPPLLALRGIARTFGFFKDEAKGATAQTGQQAAAAGVAAAKTVDHTAAMEAAKVKAGELTGKLKELKQGFQQQVDAVRDSIQAYDGLIAKSDVTAKEVVGDLHNQVSNFRTYSRDTQRLIKAGVNPAAIQELSQKGPQYVHALATGSNRELNRYKQYWRDRQAEVKGGFAKSMQGQYEDLVRKMRAMQREINKLKGKTVDVKAEAHVEIKESTRRGLLALGIKGYGTKFFRHGGRIPGYGGGDTEPIMAEKGEAVVSKEDARRPDFRAWAKERGIPGYRRGGIVGGFEQPAVQAVARYGQLAATELGKAAGKELGKAIANAAQFTGGTGAGFGSGSWMRAINELRREQVPYSIVSTFRPGARTRASGSVSFHALNRAVDLDGGHDKMRIWRALTDTGPTELIYSRAPSYKSRSGWHPISRLDPITRADHYSHVHAAYKKGGLIPEDVFGVGRSGRTYGFHGGETVVPKNGGDVHFDIALHFHGPVLGDMRRFEEAITPGVRSALKAALRREGKIALANQL